ncbi:MAG: CDP-diacylglycerol--serine O-phosphatidyltransferase [Myxococcales bacterium]|nr:CDP-diacylglycerol--serine O-phosphatidyltransferase [Myxococcales bacterium]
MTDVTPNPRVPRRRRRRRNRRAGGESFRAMALLPHLFTTANLAAGFYAIVRAAQGDVDRAALAIFVAGICDALDGRIARLTGETSRFGFEYDSIADTVSFGVAPAMVAWSAGSLHELGWTGWVLAFMFTACAALRLARFNVTPARYSGYFEGLPSPAGAGMIVSTVWLSGFLRESGIPLDPPPALAGLGAALLGLLMVSPIPYWSGKQLNLGGGYRTTVLMVLAFAVMLSKPSVTFFLFGIGYVASGPLEWWWRRRTGTTLEEAQVEPGSGDVPSGSGEQGTHP